MRRIALVPLLAALAFATGCFALDEVDRGRASMKKHAGGYRSEGVPAPTAEAASDDGADDETPGLVARAQAWWEAWRAEPPAQRPADDEIVRCDLEDGVTFTYESDCLSRGGAPAEG
jgi:hypothetical protein